jgi:hypothetical protein
MSRELDAVAWMRERREQIDREDADLGYGDRARRTPERLESDPLWLRLEDRAVRACRRVLMDPAREDPSARGPTA